MAQSTDYEKLGAFYLGKRIENGETTDELTLYDSADLTTHAVIVGMTGSGKTGLGIGLIEEAAIDKVPVIAIDPKGDLGNLLLGFPKLSATDFRPWVNEQEARNQGMTVDEFASGQASLWKKGLKSWGQSGERIKKLNDSVDMAIYTPGSSAGRPISVLQSFNAPPAALREDRDTYTDRLQATASSLLSLMGIHGDAITSREHILISNILKHHWDAGRSLNIADMIAAIQSPPISKIGVMDLESIYPAKDRFSLAMALNNLLAAPGFDAWMEGEPLDANGLFYTASGKPRVSVMSIAHLNDEQRMFFVAMLLGEILSWMRAQPGTSSLRAILYMDEIFGYMPPSANPPSKLLLLTMLKQARAFGLGVVLSTQNPVDLDYKGLSNTGTWFIGRMQTERDKARVMDGLEGASGGKEFDKPAMERLIAGLGKRQFLLHNVHESEDVVFSTRWVMSYLAGPLTRDQIKRLEGDKPAVGANHPLEPSVQPKATVAQPTPDAPIGPPLLPPSVPQLYLPVNTSPAGDLVYFPYVVGAAEVQYTRSRPPVDAERAFVMMVEVEDGPIALDWQYADVLGIDARDLETRPEQEAAYADCPAILQKAANYKKWDGLYKRWLKDDNPLTIYTCKELKESSDPGESEGQFRARLQQVARERRDEDLAELRKKYGAKLSTARDKLLRAEQAVEREEDQAKSQKFSTAISFGTALLSAFTGRKKVSARSASRMGSAIKGVGRMQKEKGDIARAEEKLEVVQQQLTDLEAEFEREIAAREDSFDAQSIALDEVSVRAKSTGVHVQFVALAWAPHWRESDGRVRPAW